MIETRNHFVPGGKPSGALVKAMLVNGAARIEGNFSGEVPNGANPVSGFGRVDLATTLAMGNEAMLFDDEPDHAVVSGEMRVYRVQPRDTTRGMSVTLVWTDAPSLPGNGSLENKLYLQIRTPAGVVLDGDVTPFPSPTNNVQRVVIPAGVAGTYEIRVRGVDVTAASPGATPSGGGPRQDYALVASNVTGLTMQP